MELLVTILKLTTFSLNLLLQIASSLLLVALNLLQIMGNFLNILGSCFSSVKNFLLRTIIEEISSGYLLTSNMELSVITVNI